MWNKWDKRGSRGRSVKEAARPAWGVGVTRAPGSRGRGQHGKRSWGLRRAGWDESCFRSKANPGERDSVKHPVTDAEQRGHPAGRASPCSPIAKAEVPQLPLSSWGGTLGSPLTGGHRPCGLVYADSEPRSKLRLEPGRVLTLQRPGATSLLSPEKGWVEPLWDSATWGSGASHIPYSPLWA